MIKCALGKTGKSLPLIDDPVDILDSISYGGEYGGINIWKASDGVWEVCVFYGKETNSGSVTRDINIADGLVTQTNLYLQAGKGF